ncbi:MAG: hypothetical protein AAF193_10135, partial [Bacteroidota bacterium]
MKVLISIIVLLMASSSFAQSIEVMPGTENTFFDIQFLKPIKKGDYRFTTFSRTRGIVDYGGNANILSAAYVSYTSKIGLGTTAIGYVNSDSGPGIAGGINFLKSTESFSVFSLISIEAGTGLGYSFFSIL